MKHILIILSMIPTFALAEPTAYDVRRTLKDTTTIVALDLNPATVFCTNRGYSTIQLKISVPDLDWLAHFDHRVVGEQLPCITGGECTSQLQPGVIIDPKDPIVLAPMRVILIDILSIDEDKKACTHILTETIHGLVRGINFDHYKNSDPEAMDFNKCMKLKDQP